MRWTCFILEFLKCPRQVGTFTQSSKFLAKKVAQEIDGSSDVIEFGPGAGAVTLEILKHLPENGRLTCFEINQRFIGYLQCINDSRLKIINDDAKNCEQYVGRLECIVSCLPLRLFSKSQRQSLLGVSSKSRKYIQLQYAPFLKRKLKNYFRDVKMKIVLLNLPPMFIYICDNTMK